MSHLVLRSPEKWRVSGSALDCFSDGFAQSSSLLDWDESPAPAINSDLDLDCEFFAACKLSNQPSKSVESHSDYLSDITTTTETEQEHEIFGDDSELPSSDYESNDSVLSGSPTLIRHLFLLPSKSNLRSSMSDCTEPVHDSDFPPPHKPSFFGQNHDRRKQSSLLRRFHPDFDSTLEVLNVESLSRVTRPSPKTLQSEPSSSSHRPTRKRRRPGRFSSYTNDFVGNGGCLYESSQEDRKMRFLSRRQQQPTLVEQPKNQPALSSLSDVIQGVGGGVNQKTRFMSARKVTVESNNPVKTSDASDNSLEPFFGTEFGSSISGPLNRRRHLLNFIVELLNHRHSCVEWIDRQERVFQISSPEQLTRLWGQYKKNGKMTFESLSRSLRLYYAPKKLERIQGRRHQYRLLHYPSRGSKSRLPNTRGVRTRDTPSHCLRQMNHASPTFKLTQAADFRFSSCPNTNSSTSPYLTRAPQADCCNSMGRRW
ncbi:hypothetical protein Ciccas_004013 [Cichlidogyrus casuarinus]|uniref:ETS domain-containing protein n=1 Tax=Cichlidogyrus casuarinus TaxID=1844966 RepID=A0ABD2QCP6_9PLAT